MGNFLGRLIICVDGGDKSYILWNGTEAYYQKLREAYLDIKNDKDTKYLHFGFFTLCASTLEFSLNFLLTNYCVNHFGHEDYKKYAEAYIGLPFSKKLLMAPSIISNGKYMLNEDNTSFKTLKELIALRNKILHNKEFLQEFDFPLLNDVNQKVPIEFQIQMGDNPIDSLDKQLCLRYGDALGQFKTLIMIPALENNLEINEMIRST
ncbi:MAG: hypothetical protein LBP67_05355 [Bacteroidales bacterium]|jgi:hypothetical protein|nr:hypothetical protein [Bacteroidales bacterium]